MNEQQKARIETWARECINSLTMASIRKDGAALAHLDAASRASVEAFRIAQGA
jgi:hypothetical protein